MAKRAKRKGNNKRVQNSVKRPVLHTFCPICTVSISIDNLEKHLRKAHPRTSHVLCSACGTYFNQDQYPKHVSTQHFNVLAFSEKALIGLRDDFKARYYVSSSANKDLLCTKCNKNIKPENIMEHVLSKHQDSYIQANLLSVSHIFSKKTPVATNQPNLEPDSTVSQKNSASKLRRETSIKPNTSKVTLNKGIQRNSTLSGSQRIDRGKSRLLVNDKVPLRICKVLIYRSAHWIQDKKTNKIVRAKAHYKNITHKPNGAAFIPFGRMDFLVELAASKIIELVLHSTDSNAELKIDKDEFIYKARQIVSNSVETEGTLCNRYHIRSNGFMLFGNQAIHVPTFIMTITDAFELKIHIPY